MIILPPLPCNVDNRFITTPVATLEEWLELKRQDPRRFKKPAKARLMTSKRPFKSVETFSRTFGFNPLAD